MVEQLAVRDYEYYKTPLRPTSGDAIESTVFVNDRRGHSRRQDAAARQQPGRPDGAHRQAANSVQYFFGQRMDTLR